MNITLAKFIYDLLKIIKEIFFAYKIRSSLLTICIIICCYCGFKFYEELIYKDSNSVFLNTQAINNFNDKTQIFLAQCRDKISFSLLSVSTEEKNMISSPTGKAFKTIFAICNGFDESKGGLLDLRNQLSIIKGKPRLPYKNTYYLSTIFADFLERLSGSIDPYVVNTQYEESIPADIKQFLEQTQWYSEKIMHTLYLQSVINEKEKLIYILALTSAEVNPNCDNSTLREFITKLKEELK